jgi:hypothetical protein
MREEKGAGERRREQEKELNQWLGWAAVKGEGE